jgi:hypothetical protein
LGLQGQATGVGHCCSFGSYTTGLFGMMLQAELLSTSYGVLCRRPLPYD